MNPLQVRHVPGSIERAGFRTPSRPLVLIIEDDPWIQAVASELLEDEGYATASAKTGEVGLSMAQQLHPVVILLDLGLPTMSGAEFLSCVQRHAALRGTPVIVVSGQSELFPSEATKLAAGFLRKPFDMSDLLDRVRRCTGYVRDGVAAGRQAAFSG